MMDRAMTDSIEGPTFRGWDLATTEDKHAEAMIFRRADGSHAIHYDWSVNADYCRYCGVTAMAIHEGLAENRVCARPQWPLEVSVPPPPMRGRMREHKPAQPLMIRPDVIIVDDPWADPDLTDDERERKREAARKIFRKIFLSRLPQKRGDA